MWAEPFHFHLPLSTLSLSRFKDEGVKINKHTKPFSHSVTEYGLAHTLNTVMHIFWCVCVTQICDKGTGNVSFPKAVTSATNELVDSIEYVCSLHSYISIDVPPPKVCVESSRVGAMKVEMTRAPVCFNSFILHLQCTASHLFWALHWHTHITVHFTQSVGTISPELANRLKRFLIFFFPLCIDFLCVFAHRV